MPPRIAVWLVDLCAAPEQSETILGDLSEEFSSIATDHGEAAARWWYWREAAKTVAHLLASQAREAPWVLLSVAVIGWFLPVIYGTAIQRAVGAIHRRWQVYAHIDPYSFWLIYWVL